MTGATPCRVQPAAGDHLLYSDELAGILHLCLESRSSAVSWHAASLRCAEELDGWLERRGEREVDRLLVTTVLEHLGDLDPIVDVLVRRRPRLSRLLLGAVSFPDFARGSYTPADLDRDGSSWRLSLSSPAQLLTSL